MDDVTGKKCKLLKVIRDHGGKSRYHEENPTIIRTIENLGRTMYAVIFQDGATTFVFTNEVEVLTENDSDS